jgi:hypothetical protein
MAHEEKGRGTLRRTVSGGMIAAALALLAGLAAPGTAPADTAAIIAPSDPDNPTVNSGWQAGTCYTDPPCSVATPSEFFEQAAGHPPVGFTQFIVKNEDGVVGPEEPVDELKTVRVDLPVGLTVNPQATPQCPQATFEADPATCPAGSAVGESLVTASLLGVPTPLPGPPPVVYNIIPPDGEPARFGLHLLGNDIYLRADVAWDSDYHEGFTIDVPETPFAELPLLEGGVVLKNRLVFDGTSGDGTFITTPTTCLGPAEPPFVEAYSTWLLAASLTEEEDPSYDFPGDAQPPFESRIPPGTSPKECDEIPFDPTIDAEAGTAQTDSPAGPSVTVNVPEIEDPGKEEEQGSSHVRSARASLPLGMGLNPSAANGLVACTDSQFGLGTRASVACPDASRVGAVSVETPPLPPGSLSGDVFIGQQLSRDPASGDAYRIFVTAESARYGVSARLLGKVRADPRTGRLTTTFDDVARGKAPLPGLPQVPFSAFELDFEDGPRAPLTSPATCGPHTAATELTPWSGNPDVTPEDDFSLSSAPGAGDCAATLGERPFAPGFGAAGSNPRAGKFSPFSVGLTREDGEQELKAATVDLPPGLTAKLAGLTYCPEAAISAASRRSAAEESGASSCPAGSLVGSATVHAGSGPEPLQISGKAFLAGPYDGAPLSLAIVTPAAAGPFDLGSVVARVALFVDRLTARVRAISDPIPHVFGGALLDIGSITVALDRPGFSLNPTNCSPLPVTGTVNGGGSNPEDPAAFSSVRVSAPFQVSGCDALGFRPKLFFRLFGATRRAKNPKLRAVVVARDGDANISRAVVTLPRGLILDQGNIGRVCTRVQYAAGACPKHSIYGYARAFTPLLDEPLQGPVFLRSSDNLLPDLVASLRGQFEIDLVGRTDSRKGRIRNSFDVLPDVPVSKFILTVRGGKRGILTNSRNLCPKKGGKRRRAGASAKRKRRKLRATARFFAHNGKSVRQRPKLRLPCGKKGAKRRGAGRR